MQNVGPGHFPECSGMTQNKPKDSKTASNNNQENSSVIIINFYNFCIHFVIIFLFSISIPFWKQISTQWHAEFIINGLDLVLLPANFWVLLVIQIIFLNHDTPAHKQLIWKRKGFGWYQILSENDSPSVYLNLWSECKESPLQEAGSC